MEIKPRDDLKWLQLPDLTPLGIDIRVDSADGRLRVLADDFLCKERSLLTDVHFWGSWLRDFKGEIRNIHLSIHSDDPVGPGGSNPNNQFSQPDQLLWERDFGREAFREQLVAVLPEGEFFWDAAQGELIPQGDKQLWEYTIEIDPKQAFLQLGTSDAPQTYWLDVSVKLFEPGPAAMQFGWKTRVWPEHFQDDAVIGPQPWRELRYPPGHPYSMPPMSNSIDMAFALTFEPAPQVEIDWGDAPDPSYPTLSASNGARHMIVPGLRLGNLIDAEPNGQPNAAATGDDLSGVDDEDGVVLTSPLIPGEVAKFDVTVTNAVGTTAFLDAWIDLDRDGSFSSTPLEQFAISAPVVNGVNTFALPLSLLVTSGPTYARFRLSSTGGLQPSGPARDGEVEDYLVEIKPREDLKWLQRPDLTPWGIDMRVDSADGRLRVLADDFRCEKPSLLTDVHFWGSWLRDLKGEIRNIHLSVHSDDPIGPGGSDPNNQFSKPDQLLWEMDFGRDAFREQLAAVLLEGEFFWDILEGEPIPQGDKQLWEYSIEIDPKQAFLQLGTPDKPEIYWLDISVKLSEPTPIPTQFGWKTRVWPEHFQDDAVIGPQPWRELRYPPGHPYSMPPGPGSIDMAFALTFEPAPEMDWGDAPDPRYPTLYASNGARHIIVPGIVLGKLIDAELNGQPNADATGDDRAGLNDEDGVTFPKPLLPGTLSQVDVMASAPGNVSAWVDMNRDGDWDDAGEQILADQAVNAGMNSLSFAVPNNVKWGRSFARIRYSTQKGLRTTGLATDGEVTDLRVRVANLSPVADPDGRHFLLKGDNVTLDGSRSYDPNKPDGDSIVSYEWDLGDDGSYEYNGVKPTVPWADLVNRIQPDIPLPVRLRVTDTLDDADTKATTLTIVTGDFNRDGLLTVVDIDLLTAASAAGTHDPVYDLNGDKQVDLDDIYVWIKRLKGTWIGDADVNGVFDSNDFVDVFVIGKYETGRPAVWHEGDWNGDGFFSTDDFVEAFVDGGYELGPTNTVRAASAPNQVASALFAQLSESRLSNARLADWSGMMRQTCAGICGVHPVGSAGSDVEGDRYAAPSRAGARPLQLVPATSPRSRVRRVDRRR